MYFNSDNTKPRSFICKRLVASVSIFAISVIVPFLHLNIAHAGLFSFISSLLGSEQVSAQVERIDQTPNSQTMALLYAAVSSDPNPHKSAGSVPVQGNALVAYLGPDGVLTEEQAINTTISTYVVREGDTLSEIADMFEVSINTIVWANDLGGAKSTIQPGQTLIILPVSGIRYTIKSGDTISTIVDKYEANTDEVLQYNGLSLSSTLVEGQVIIIPDADVPQVLRSSSSPTPKTSSVSSASYYTRPINGGKKSQGLHGYNAVDLAAPIGTPIYASADGVVIAVVGGSGWNGGYGNYVIISHSNGTQTLYAHNSKNLVSVGERVSQGETIATVGTTGKSTGPHVHFEVRGAKNPF